MLWRVTQSVLFFELKGRTWIIERMSEKQQSWHGRMGLSSLGSYVKNFLLNLLTSESSRCASDPGRKKEKLHSWIEKVPVEAEALFLSLPSILPVSFFFFVMRRHCRTLGDMNWLKMFCSLLNAVPSHIWTLSSLDSTSPTSFFPVSLLSLSIPTVFCSFFPHSLLNPIQRELCPPPLTKFALITVKNDLQWPICRHH